MELNRRDQEMLAMGAKMKTLEEQHHDYQRHIAVLKESLAAKEEHHNMLQADVSSFSSTLSWISCPCFLNFLPFLSSLVFVLHSLLYYSRSLLSSLHLLLIFFILFLDYSCMSSSMSGDHVHVSCRSFPFVISFGLFVLLSYLSWCLLTWFTDFRLKCFCFLPAQQPSLLMIFRWKNWGNDWRRKTSWSRRRLRQPCLRLKTETS